MKTTFLVFVFLLLIPSMSGGQTAINVDGGTVNQEKTIQADYDLNKGIEFKLVTGGSCTVNVCAMYQTTAEMKAKQKCGVLGTQCGCFVTRDTCGQNWRGAYKHIYECHCN